MRDATPNGDPLKFIGRQPIQAVDPDGDGTMRDAVTQAAFALLTPEQLAEIAISRGLIEDAMDCLVHVYDVDADNAFEILRWWSQATNVNLRLLAQRLTEELASFGDDELERVRAACDTLLFAQHHPVAPPLSLA